MIRELSQGGEWMVVFQDQLEMIFLKQLSVILDNWVIQNRLILHIIRNQIISLSLLIKELIIFRIRNHSLRFYNKSSLRKCQSDLSLVYTILMYSTNIRIKYNHQMQVIQNVIIRISRIIAPLSQWFNDKTKNTDFFLLALIYSIIFIIIGIAYHKKKGWIAKNKELLTWKEAIGAKIIAFISELPIVRLWWNKKLKKQESKLQFLFDQEFTKTLDHKRVEGIPVQGMSVDNIRHRINDWTKREHSLTTTQKISGSIYFSYDESYLQDIRNFSKTYLYHNPLHLDTYKQVLRMQSEVLQMTANLLTSPNQKVYGSITSGGSESLILSIHTYKNYYSDKTKPNIVVPETIHAAVDKGCFYFNVQCRKARIKENFEVDVKHMESLIDSNTIMVAGSAGNFPHGIIDDITSIAKLGKKYNIGVHVDACLGGFIISFGESLKADLPQFSFKVDGVTSISIDHHKFGLAPKGASAIFYKTKELRQSQYYCKMDWCGGVYGTPTMVGSRNAVGSAGAWFAFNRITYDGYKQNALNIIQTTKQMVEQMRKIDQIKVFGDPKLCVISFTTKTISIFKLLKFMQKSKDWHISALHRPEGAHMTITLANYMKMRKEFIRDLKQGIEQVKKNGDKYKGSTEALYGGTAEIPSTSVRQNVLKVILKSYLK